MNPEAMKAIPILIAALLLAGCANMQKHAAAAAPVSIEGKTLASGAKIEGLIVNDDMQHRSWSPSGAPFAEWVRPVLLGLPSSSPRPNPERTRAILLRLSVPTDSSEMPTVVFREDGGKEFTGSTMLEGRPPRDEGKPRGWTAWYSKSFRGLSKVDVSVGIASGPWQSVGAYRQTNGKFEHVSGSAFNPLVIPEPVPKGKPGETCIAIVMAMPSSPRARAFRLHVTDKKGQPLLGAGSFSPKDEGATEYWFSGQIQDVGTIELQSRAFEWEHVPDVRLDPGT